MDQKGRRKLQRFEHGNLIVKVKKAGLLNLIFAPRIVSWLDFHQEGISFISDKKYAIGTLLKLNLTILDENRMQADNIIAEVMNIQVLPEGYRYGLEFAFDQNGYMRTPQVKSNLCDMEKLLEKIYFELTGKPTFHPDG